LASGAVGGEAGEASFDLLRDGVDDGEPIDIALADSELVQIRDERLGAYIDSSNWVRGDCHGVLLSCPSSALRQFEKMMRNICGRERQAVAGCGGPAKSTWISPRPQRWWVR
jgi:hypothetical protein